MFDSFIYILEKYGMFQIQYIMIMFNVIIPTSSPDFIVKHSMAITHASPTNFCNGVLRLTTTDTPILKNDISLLPLIIALIGKAGIVLVNLFQPEVTVTQPKVICN